MDYIIAGGTKQLVELLDEDSEYLDYAKEHDRLGWDCFLEGRISSSLLEIQRDCLHRAGAYMTIKTWSKQFIHHMLCVTHRQWTYRNARTHLKKIEGRTQEDHDRVRNEVRALLAVQPEDLLPTHRHLLQFNADTWTYKTRSEEEFIAMDLGIVEGIGSRLFIWIHVQRYPIAARPC
eukprot:scaffold41755_cov46-Cyclotella_meneghiniana.AAC.1